MHDLMRPPRMQDLTHLPLSTVARMREEKLEAVLDGLMNGLYKDIDEALDDLLQSDEDPKQQHQQTTPEV